MNRDFSQEICKALDSFEGLAGEALRHAVFTNTAKGLVITLDPIFKPCVEGREKKIAEAIHSACGIVTIRMEYGPGTMSLSDVKEKPRQ